MATYNTDNVTMVIRSYLLPLHAGPLAGRPLLEPRLERMLELPRAICKRSRNREESTGTWRFQSMDDYIVSHQRPHPFRPNILGAHIHRLIQPLALFICLQLSDTYLHKPCSESHSKTKPGLGMRLCNIPLLSTEGEPSTSRLGDVIVRSLSMRGELDVRLMSGDGSADSFKSLGGRCTPKSVSSPRGGIALTPTTVFTPKSTGGGGF